MTEIQIPARAAFGCGLLVRPVAPAAGGLPPVIGGPDVLRTLAVLERAAVHFEAYSRACEARAFIRVMEGDQTHDVTPEQMAEFLRAARAAMAPGH